MGRIYITDGLIGNNVNIYLYSDKVLNGILMDVDNRWLKLKTGKIILLPVRDIRFIEVVEEIIKKED